MRIPDVLAIDPGSYAGFGASYPGVGNFETWLQNLQVRRTLEKSAEQFREQGEAATADRDVRRRQDRLERLQQMAYVQAQQNLQKQLPNFTDTEQLRNQTEWLQRSL